MFHNVLRIMKFQNLYKTSNIGFVTQIQWKLDRLFSPCQVQCIKQYLKIPGNVATQHQDHKATESYSNFCWEP